MKKLIVLIALAASNTFGQFHIESNFNVVATARNQSLVGNYNFGNVQLGLGIKYNFNKLNNFPQETLFKRAFYALHSEEHWGAELNLKYNFARLRDVVLISSFYNLQFTRSHVRFERAAIAGQSENGESNLFCEKNVDYLGPVIGLENNIGIAFDINLTPKFFLTQKFGVGILLHKDSNPDKVFYYGGGDWDWVFSEMLSFGIGYRFGKKQ